MVQRKQRKLKSVYDPKMTSTSGKAARKAAATAAPASSQAPSAKAPKVTRPAGGKKTPEVHPADKEFDNKRAKVLADRNNGGKVKRLSGKEALAARMKLHTDRVEAFDKSAAQQKKLLEMRKKVQESNLKQRQIASGKNLNGRLKARRAALLSKKPVLKDGKVVVPKGIEAKYTPVEAKLKPLPRILKGKIVTTPPKAPKVTAAEHTAGVKAARTRGKGGAKDAN